MLTLKKTVKVIQKTFIKTRQEHLIMFRMADNSFLIAFESDAGEHPEMLLGCIGQWVNTDEFEFAEDIFHGIESRQEAKFVNHVTSVIACTTWRELLLRAIH